MERKLLFLHDSFYSDIYYASTNPFMCLSAARTILGLARPATMPPVLELLYSDEPFPDSWCIEYDYDAEDDDESYRLSSPNNAKVTYTELHTLAEDLVGQCQPLYFQLRVYAAGQAAPAVPDAPAGPDALSYVI